MLFEFESQLEAGGFRTVQTGNAEEDKAADMAPCQMVRLFPSKDLRSMIISGRIPESVWRNTRERYFTYLDAMRQIYRRIRIAREKLNAALVSLKKETIRPGIDEECSAISENWEEKTIRAYLKNLEKDVIENSDWITGYQKTMI